ncbi:unnamed protein product [Linum trigynum]|uniref:Uncharacterized protein n=1 Tax=Linum trigynum TaxID=586398 RepID=A0AAV2GKG9_9ROSI
MGAFMSRFGKTTTLYKLHLGEVVTTHPTVGSNVEEVVYKNIRFERQVWDLEGQERLTTSWASYCRGTHAIIAATVLVFANKQDMKDATTPAEITDTLSLHIIKNHDWHIQACCVLIVEDLYDGLGWIAQHVIGKAPS